MAGFLSPLSHSPVSKPHPRSAPLLIKYKSRALGSPKKCEILNFHGQTYFVAKMHAQDHTYSHMHMVHTPCRTWRVAFKGFHIAPCDLLKRAYLSFLSIIGSILILNLFPVSTFYPHCLDSFTFSHGTDRGEEGGMFWRSFPLVI